MLVQLLFTPSLAGWKIWVGIAVSARSTDVRVAQQLSVLGSLPLLVILALISPNVITVSTALALGLAAAPLAVDLLGWRAVAMFDRERLITGRRMTVAATLASVAEHQRNAFSETRGDQQCPQR